ncbi:hypothetical protein ACO229_20060 [Promicromonospora sp. MS192]|uniref:hypothetical protein n=1 Tax=Promicromonospora sp. MS192 TaxID=3412684 RepID=UPI003C302A48
MSHDDLNNDFLSGALRGAADAMPGGEADDLHVSFGVVRDRVRRRRAVKVGSLAGASLVVAGVLAFGVTQSPVWNTSEPVLPGDPTRVSTPDGSANPTQAPDPAPSGPAATSVIEDGYQPSWIRDLGAGLECGMPVEDLRTTATGWSVASAGDIYARTSDFGGEAVPTWHMGATVEGGSLGVSPVLVWSQDGVVVDLGTNVFEGTVPGDPLLGAGNGAVEAQSGAYTMCAPSDGPAGDLFETSLPEGDYEVRVLAFPEVTPGQWATAVSEPVDVRLDADGAHTATGTRGGPATIEPPEPAEGELSRFVLDRSTDWVTADMTWTGYVTVGVPRITAECESTNPADVVRYEVTQASAAEPIASGTVPCDGTTFESEDVVGGGEESYDIRLTSVPDGVARFWATLAPGTGGEAAGDCSASGMTLRYDLASAPSQAVGATAQTIVDAALACDSDQLVELANQHGTELMFGTETAEQTFALPDDTQHYRTLVALLAGTTGAADAETGVVRWPRVVSDEFRDDDAAWDEVVAAGLLTQEQADGQRADETFGYTGMTIAIDPDGTWSYYSADE